MTHWNRYIGLVLMVGGLLTHSFAVAQEKGGQKQAPPPPVVDVITATPQTLTLTENLPARLEASREAVIVPRISGIVERRLFTEGASVKAGKALYELDDDTFQAALGSAQAALAQAQARLAQAKANRDLFRSTVNRYAPLVKAKAISRQAYDEAVAQLKVQESNILAAQAGIKAAQEGVRSATINLGYAMISSPIDGVIGRSNVSEGAYVLASQTQLAKVQQLNPMYVNITQPASKLMALRKQLHNGAPDASAAAEIEIYFEDGTPYAHKGRLLFVNQTVDANTGEVTLRAEVPNPQGELLPGLYVRVALPQSSLADAYLIPQQALTRGDKNVVMIAEADGKYHPQVVEVVGQQGQDWVVKGLTSGQQVIVDGMGQMAIMMGAPVVKTRPWQKGAGQAKQSAEQSE